MNFFPLSTEVQKQRMPACLLGLYVCFQTEKKEEITKDIKDIFEF